MQLIDLYSFNSAPIFVPLLCRRWFINDGINAFAEKVNVAVLMV